jgi:polysaccharide biosynthesis transport protein
MDVPLNFNRQSRNQFEREESSSDSLSLSETAELISSFVRRQFPIFVFIFSCAIALGLVYLFTTPASYTSHAMLLIDSSKVRILQQEAPMGDVPIDTAQVETQVEILKSENIGLSVIKDLKLAEDPELAGSGGGLVGSILGLFSPPKAQSETGLTRQALATFLAKRTVLRVGRTYVLDIGYTSLSPHRSANIANAIADAYIVDQLESKYQATRRASGWLQDRIKELRQQASDADRAVLEYKEKNHIVAVGGGAVSGNGPRLLGEQQLEELNTQLGSARAAAEEAKARLERIDEVMKRDVPDATVADSLRSEVINRLRNNYLDMAAKEAIWSARYGANHLAAVNLRTQMAEMRRSILDELGRIAQSYRSDYEIAKTRVDGVERNLQSLVANSQVINRDRLGLTDLESTAKVYHTIYDNFLQRYMEAIQQQSFPITEARVISAAAPSERKSSPLTLTVLGIAAAIGLLLSLGTALLRDAIDRVFRTARQVESNLQARCLAVLPLLVASNSTKMKRPIGVQAAGRRGSAASIAPSVAPEPADMKPESQIQDVTQLTQSELRRSSSKKSGIDGLEHAAAKRPIVANRPFMREVIDKPLSAFAEAFRSIKVAADISGSRVIGITSTVPGEGKSTVASNLAELMAHAGKRVLVLDCDLRNPSLTRGLVSHPKAGLLEVLGGQVSLEDALYVDQETDLRFLPAVLGSRVAYTNEILASENFKNFVESQRKEYDFIVIDLPPIAPVVDVRSTTQIVDSYLYVIQWGSTQMNLVTHQMSGFPELQDRLLGCVLNKADVRVLQRYEAYYGKNYYNSYYGDPSST